MKKINYAGPSITSDDINAVKDAVEHGFYENYKKNTTDLENKLCELLDIKYALATNSCTAALHLALASLDLEEGDEIITSDSSCVATALPINYVGAKAVFVDIDPITWNLCPDSIARAITKNTKAILVVHWNGIPADMDKIMKIASDNNLRVVEDAAPGLGADYKNKKIGTIGDLGCFSFQGAKVAIGGQGGALVTDNFSLIEKAKCFAAYGRTDSKMTYWSDYVGWNYTMPNLPAALAHSQIQRLEDLVEKKRNIYQWYSTNLKDIAHISLIKELNQTKATYCYPGLMLDKELNISKDEFLSNLNEKGIDIRTAQPRMSKMPMFNSDVENYNARAVEERGVILPSAFNLQKSDIDFVCEEIIKNCNHE